VDGQILPASTDGTGRHIFTLPAGARHLRLLSRTARPTDRAPWCGDRRLLGVAIGSLAVDGVALPLEQLGDGWHGMEHTGTHCWRWTNGAGQIDLPMAGTVLEAMVTGTMAYGTTRPLGLVRQLSLQTAVSNKP
jgi:hypothetical protein